MSDAVSGTCDECGQRHEPGEDPECDDGEGGADPLAIADEDGRATREFTVRDVLVACGVYVDPEHVEPLVALLVEAMEGESSGVSWAFDGRLRR